MQEKHLKRIKKSDTGNTEEDEWEEIPTLGQKIDDQLLEEIPDRTIRVEKEHWTNIDAYDKDAPKKLSRPLCRQRVFRSVLAQG